jgi:hypothetical protein
VPYTYNLGDVVNAAAATIPRISEAKYVDLICNGTQQAIWDRFDWRETIAALPPFWCVPDQQDYGAPEVIVPTNFSGLRKAQMFQIQQWPEIYWDLKCLRELPVNGARGISDSISYNKSTQSFRLSRRPTGNMAAGNWMVSGDYKILPTKVTKANYTTFPLFSDDKYFDVWLAMMKAVATKYVPSIPNKDSLLQEATIELLKMASDEGFDLGETPIAPSEGLVTGYYGNAGAGGPWTW